ncbi:MAG: hypothetical protein C4342_05200, partial [Armatimonadota bacterium]
MVDTVPPPEVPPPPPEETPPPAPRPLPPEPPDAAPAWTSRGKTENTSRFSLLAAKRLRSGFRPRVRITPWKYPLVVTLIECCPADERSVLSSPEPL